MYVIMNIICSSSSSSNVKLLLRFGLNFFLFQQNTIFLPSSIVDCERGAGGGHQPHCTPPSMGFGGVLGKLMVGVGMMVCLAWRNDLGPCSRLLHVDIGLRIIRISLSWSGARVRIWQTLQTTLTAAAKSDTTIPVCWFLWNLGQGWSEFVCGSEMFECTVGQFPDEALSVWYTTVSIVPF